MAKNFIQDGDIIDAVAPSGGVTSGAGVLIGTAFGVAMRSAAEGATFPLRVTGVFELPKLSSDNITAGAAVYWDNTNKRVTVTASGNSKIGFATAAAAASTATVHVRLNGVSV